LLVFLKLMILSLIEQPARISHIPRVSIRSFQKIITPVSKNPEKRKSRKKRTSTLYFLRKLRHVPCPSQQLTSRLAVSQNPLRTPLCHRNIRQQAGLGSNLIDSSSAQSGPPRKEPSS
ncbi:MAG: hypothetical protein ACKON9_30560, partial [Planctomycetaceae bacterium]